MYYMELLFFKVYKLILGYVKFNIKINSIFNIFYGDGFLLYMELFFWILFLL